MKINTLFVTTLISMLFVIIPTTSQATCSAHKAQQAENATSVGEKNTVAGGDGTGIGDKLMTGNETAVGGQTIAGGDGTGIGGALLIANEPSASETQLVK